MEIREESGLKFGFPDGSIAIKFDDTKYYRDLFNALPGSKGIDFISVGKDAISFIEVICHSVFRRGFWWTYPVK